VAIETGDTFESPRSGGTITVLESWRDNDGARVAIERVMPPNTGKAAAHYHLDFAQKFDVVSGDASVEVEKEELNLVEGESVEIPIGKGHRDMWNEGPDEATIRLTIEPVPRFVEMYATTWLDSYAKGKTNDQDEMTLLQILVIARASDGKSYADRPPRRFQDLTLPLIAAIGRLRGYKALG
jgi:mannose-6-phosphate isomerase-like protein (cupin superfamily)